MSIITNKLTITEKWFLLVCGIACFLLSSVFLWSSYGPDEVSRFIVPLYMLNHSSIPSGSEPEVMIPIWGFSYALNLTLPYFISWFFMKVASLFTMQYFVLLIAARMTSVLSYVGIVYYSLRISHKLSEGFLRWSFVLIMSFTPQIIFLGSYFNLDIFALFTAVMITNYWFDCLETNWSTKNAILLGISCGLCLVSYAFAYSFVFMTLLLYCFWHMVNRHSFELKRFLLTGLVILSAALVISGWYFIRNAVLYDGDFLSLHTRTYYAELYAQTNYKPSLHETAKLQGESIQEMLVNTEWLRSTAMSMICILGYMNIIASKWVYIGFQIIIAIGGFGCIASFISSRVSSIRSYALNQTTNTWVAFTAIIAGLISLGLSIYYSWSVDYQAQGRYVIYLMVPIAIIVANGWQFISNVAVQLMGTSKKLLIEKSVLTIVTLFLLLALLDALLHCIGAFINDAFWDKDFVQHLIGQ